MTTTISAFTFCINGLQIVSVRNSKKHTLTLDPCATCELLKDAGAIEDFATDNNGEPVVLYSDNNEPQGYGYEMWYQFVSSFPFTTRTAEILIESRENAKASRLFQAKIVAMLAPLQAS